MANKKDVQMSEFSKKLRAFRTSHALTQEEMGSKLGVTADYISLLERGKKSPGPHMVRFFDIIAESPLHQSGAAPIQASAIVAETPYMPTASKPAKLVDAPSLYNQYPIRRIPIITCAQAGLATQFEEFPEHWQETIPAAIHDNRAFAIQLKGDSMEPRYSDGDIAIVLPQTPARNGDLVVANIKEEGFACKIMTLIGGDPRHIRLTSYNQAYPPMDFAREQFHFIFPVHQVTRLVRR